MLGKRIIVCLDVKGGRVVKGVNFESLRDVGDPVVLAERYEQEGADEIVYLDISASDEERSTLLDLARHFLTLSLLSIGGANAIIPEIHLRAVEIEHWMTDADFSEMFARSQAAPGPNVLIVSLIGWKAAGVVGALVAMLAMCAPRRRYA